MAGDRGTQVAAKLNRLFETRHSPKGKPYSIREVARETGLTHTTVAALRRGEVKNPSHLSIERLARFFAVDPSYFFEPSPAEEELMARLHALTKDEESLEIALKATRLTPEAKRWILSMVERELERGKRKR